MQEVIRRVVCAANMFEDGTIIASARHHDPLMNDLIRKAGLSKKPSEQGFIDQWRVFMTREEAFDVASAANQIIRRVGGDEGHLFSENLY